MAKTNTPDCSTRRARYQARRPAKSKSVTPPLSPSRSISPSWIPSAATFSPYTLPFIAFMAFLALDQLVGGAFRIPATSSSPSPNTGSSPSKPSSALAFSPGFGKPTPSRSKASSSASSPVSSPSSSGSARSFSSASPPHRRVQPRSLPRFTPPLLAHRERPLRPPRHRRPLAGGNLLARLPHALPHQ